MTATIELTERERASLAGKAPYVRRVLGAFRQAMADLGIPPHPDGKCPGAPCPCEAMGDEVEARARQLLDDPDAVPCMDCWIPLPLNVTSYAVDGGGVCGPCGIRRYGDHAGEYLINEGYEPAHEPVLVVDEDSPDPAFIETCRLPEVDAEHVDPKTWTKQTIIHHLYAHDQTFYFTSSDTKRELVAWHARLHGQGEETR